MASEDQTGEKNSSADQKPFVALIVVILVLFELYLIVSGLHHLNADELLRQIAGLLRLILAVMLWQVIKPFVL